MTFPMDAEQATKLANWDAAQNEIVRQRQLASEESFVRDMATAGHAYYGAVGGHLTYCFTPNSIGLSLVVKHSGTGAEIDLTDYDAW
jgi:hypothetical protein